MRLFCIIITFATLLIFQVKGSESLNNTNYKSDVIEENGYSLSGIESQYVHEQSAIEERDERVRRKKNKSELLKSNLELIHERYRNSITPQYAIALPADQDEATDRIKGYSRDYSVMSEEMEISTKAMKKICQDMGFDELNQRDSLEFNNCLTEAMRTKLTEETIAKRPYTTIDVKIVQILQGNTKTDASIKNLTYYEELLSQRNRLDCLKSKDYAKCSNAIVAFKECTNKTTGVILNEHNKNKVICYVKTGIKFPHPTIHEERVRDAYFGVCIHLIEKPLKQKILEMNSQCSSILIDQGFSRMAI
jgi:hypothetical protein